MTSISAPISLDDLERTRTAMSILKGGNSSRFSGFIPQKAGKRGSVVIGIVIILIIIISGIATGNALVKLNKADNDPEATDDEKQFLRRLAISNGLILGSMLISGGIVWFAESEAVSIFSIFLGLVLGATQYFINSARRAAGTAIEQAKEQVGEPDQGPCGPDSFLYSRDTLGNPICIPNGEVGPSLNTATYDQDTLFKCGEEWKDGKLEALTVTETGSDEDNIGLCKVRYGDKDKYGKPLVDLTDGFNGSIGQNNDVSPLISDGQLSKNDQFTDRPREFFRYMADRGQSKELM